MRVTTPDLQSLLDQIIPREASLAISRILELDERINIDIATFPAAGDAVSIKLNVDVPPDLSPRDLFEIVWIDWSDALDDLDGTRITINGSIPDLALIPNMTADEMNQMAWYIRPRGYSTVNKLDVLEFTNHLRAKRGLPEIGGDS